MAILCYYIESDICFKAPEGPFIAIEGYNRVRYACKKSVNENSPYTP